jgi:hypothetical protein
MQRLCACAVALEHSKWRYIFQARKTSKELRIAAVACMKKRTKVRFQKMGQYAAPAIGQRLLSGNYLATIT